MNRLDVLLDNIKKDWSPLFSDIEFRIISAGSVDVVVSKDVEGVKYSSQVRISIRDVRDTKYDLLLKLKEELFFSIYEEHAKSILDRTYPKKSLSNK